MLVFVSQCGASVVSYLCRGQSFAIQVVNFCEYRSRRLPSSQEVREVGPYLKAASSRASYVSLSSKVYGAKYVSPFVRPTRVAGTQGGAGRVSRMVSKEVGLCCFLCKGSNVFYGVLGVQAVFSSVTCEGLVGFSTSFAYYGFRLWRGFRSFFRIVMKGRAQIVVGRREARHESRVCGSLCVLFFRGLCDNDSLPISLQASLFTGFGRGEEVAFYWGSGIQRGLLLFSWSFHRIFLSTSFYVA